MPAPISLRTYARRRGVTVEAVSKAIESGRLVESVVMVADQPKISDAELADREWDANTRPRVDRPHAAPRGGAVGSGSGGGGADDEDEVPNYNVSRALREAHAARREAAMADLAEIDVGERTRELVPIEEVKAFIKKKFAIVKTRILGVPTRVAQQAPHLGLQIVAVVEALLREALEELSEGEEDENRDDGDEDDEEIEDE